MALVAQSQSQSHTNTHTTLPSQSQLRRAKSTRNTRPPPYRRPALIQNGASNAPPLPLSSRNHLHSVTGSRKAKKVLGMVAQFERKSWEEAQQRENLPKQQRERDPQKAQKTLGLVTDIPRYRMPKRKPVSGEYAGMLEKKLSQEKLERESMSSRTPSIAEQSNEEEKEEVKAPVNEEEKVAPADEVSELEEEKNDSVHEESSHEEEQPQEFIEQPHEIIEEPQEIIEEPQEIIEEPQEIIEEPQEIIEEPQEFIEQPRETIEQPRGIIEQSANDEEEDPEEAAMWQDLEKIPILDLPLQTSPQQMSFPRAVELDAGPDHELLFPPPRARARPHSYTCRRFSDHPTNKIASSRSRGLRANSSPPNYSRPLSADGPKTIVPGEDMERDPLSLRFIDIDADPRSPMSPIGGTLISNEIKNALEKLEKSSKARARSPLVPQSPPATTTTNAANRRGSKSRWSSLPVSLMKLAAKKRNSKSDDDFAQGPLQLQRQVSKEVITLTEENLQRWEDEVGYVPKMYRLGYDLLKSPIEMDLEVERATPVPRSRSRSPAPPSQTTAQMVLSGGVSALLTPPMSPPTSPPLAQLSETDEDSTSTINALCSPVPTTPFSPASNMRSETTSVLLTRFPEVPPFTDFAARHPSPSHSPPPYARAASSFSSLPVPAPLPSASSASIYSTSTTYKAQPSSSWEQFTSCSPPAHQSSHSPLADQKEAAALSALAAQPGALLTCMLCHEVEHPSAFPAQPLSTKCLHAPRTCKDCVQHWVERCMTSGGLDACRCPECGAGMGEKEVWRWRY